MSETKTNHDRSHAIFRASRQLHVFALSFRTSSLNFDWFIYSYWIACVNCDPQSDYFGSTTIDLFRKVEQLYGIL